MLSKVRAHDSLVLGVKMKVVLTKSAQLQLPVGKLTLGSKVTLSRLLVVLAQCSLVLWTGDAPHHLLTVVMVNLLAGHARHATPHANISQLHVPVCVLADGPKLTLPSRHVVLAQCTLIVWVDLRQVLLDNPQLPLTVCKAASLPKLTLFLLTQLSLVLRAGDDLSPPHHTLLCCPQFCLSMFK